MRKSVVLGICVLVVVGTVGAQQKRIYNDGQVDFAPQAARFVLTADEMESTLKEIEYTVNGGETMVYDEPIRLTDEGRHVITYRAVDAMDNVSSEKVYTVVIDDTPPTLSGTARGAGFVDDDVAYLRGDTAIILSAADELSGVEGIYVSLDGDDFFRYQDVAYIDEEGEYTGYAYTVDNVGNRSRTFSIRGRVDNTPPSVRIVPRTPLTTVQGERYSGRGNRFEVRANDETSGIDEIHVSIDRQEFVTYAGPITFTDSGYHTIRARAVDRLGNMSDTVELGFYVDVVTPDPEIRALID
ncbi:MAG: OmpL47-type beta-barrel domain-containing protein [Alkalispirochaeta sp.]